MMNPKRCQRVRVSLKGSYVLASIREQANLFLRPVMLNLAVVESIFDFWVYGLGNSEASSSMNPHPSKPLKQLCSLGLTTQAFFQGTIAGEGQSQPSTPAPLGCARS